MKKITLKNTTKAPRRGLVLNLSKASGTVKVNRTSIVATREGKPAVKRSRILVPESVHLPAGGTAGPFPESVKNDPEVRAALKRGDVKALPVQEDEPKKSKKSDKRKR